MKRGPKQKKFTLPAWFDLRKYDRAKSLSLKEWYVQLEYRRSIKLAFACPFKENENWLLIKQEGIPTFANPKELTNRYISHAIIGTIYEFEEKFPANIEKINSRKIDALNPNHDVYFTPVPFINYHTLLYVDLSKPDNELSEQFKELLPQLRTHILKDKKSVRIRRKIAHFDPKNWIKFRVLPFLDLQIWAISEKISLTNSFFAKLFDLDNEQVKDTMKPLAKKLTDFYFLERLKTRIQSP